MAVTSDRAPELIYPMPVLRAPEPTESEAQKAILQYLTLRGYFCWRNNSGVFRPANRDGKQRFVRAGKVGSSDILGMTKTGQFFAIEVKRRGKKPTPEQKEFLDAIRSNGGLALIAYSVDDVIEAKL